MENHEPSEAPVPAQPEQASGESDQGVSTLKRKGGPRTTAGKAVASRNSLRHGLFAKHCSVDHPFFAKEWKELSRLRRQLITDYDVTTVSRLIFVQIAAFSILQLDRVVRFYQGAILEANTPPIPDLDFLRRLEYSKLEREHSGVPEDPTVAEEFRRGCEADRRFEEKYRDRLDEQKRIQEDHVCIARLKNNLPNISHFELFQKVYNYHLSVLGRALAELERTRPRRATDGVGTGRPVGSMEE